MGSVNNVKNLSYSFGAYIGPLIELQLHILRNKKERSKCYEK